MGTTHKTHYRKVFKSDHLGVADLEEYIEKGIRLVFEIAQVKQEYNVLVAGRKGNFNIAYFKQTIKDEKIKPLVLNATNSKIVKKFTGSEFVEDWNNVLIELYIDTNVKMKGEVVGGVRIRPTQPKKSKPILNEQNPRWEEAKKSVKSGAVTIEGIRKYYDITDEDFKKLQA